MPSTVKFYNQYQGGNLMIQEEDLINMIDDEIALLKKDPGEFNYTEYQKQLEKLD